MKGLWTVMGVLAAIEIAALCWMVYRLRVIAALETRLDRLSDALTLLTDTTEAGLAALATEVSRPSTRRVVPASPRRATAKRLASALRRGDDVAAIASREGLSESEVRLHLAMASSESVNASIATSTSAITTRPRARLEHPGIPEISEEASHAALRA